MYRRLGGPQGRWGKYRPPSGIRPPDSPARTESLYRLNYPGPHFLRISNPVHESPPPPPGPEKTRFPKFSGPVHTAKMREGRPNTCSVSCQFAPVLHMDNKTSPIGDAVQQNTSKSEKYFLPQAECWSQTKYVNMFWKSEDTGDRKPVRRLAAPCGVSKSWTKSASGVHGVRAKSYIPITL